MSCHAIRHSPDKIPKIDKLLHKYVTREEEFLRFVHLKYGLPPPLNRRQVGDWGSAGYPQPSACAKPSACVGFARQHNSPNPPSSHSPTVVPVFPCCLTSIHVYLSIHLTQSAVVPLFPPRAQRDAVKTAQLAKLEAIAAAKAAEEEVRACVIVWYIRMRACSDR